MLILTSLPLHGVDCSLWNIISSALSCSVPESENYLGSAIVVAGPGVGAADPQPNADASRVCEKQTLASTQSSDVLLL